MPLETPSHHGTEFSEDYSECGPDPLQLTQQGEDTSQTGTHYFVLEPLGEGTYATASLKKYHRNSSDTIAELEHVTIVNLLDEGIGNECKWCKEEVVDQQRSTDYTSTVG